MRILITGAAGRLGSALAPRLVEDGHDLVLSDLHAPADYAPSSALGFVAADVRAGGLEDAAAGCDLIVHLPAWHGIHERSRSEADYWRLNVDGTFWMFQAAVARNVKRVVFLSSLAWHSAYGKYGFTKRVGEELCEYYRQNHRISYLAIRPADFTPTSTFLEHGTRLLYGGVDRDDVVAAAVASIDHLARPSNDEPSGTIVNAVRRNAFEAGQVDDWEVDPLAACGRIFGGAAQELVERYGLDIGLRPTVVDPGLGGPSIGYTPTRDFASFIDTLWLLDQSLGLPTVRTLPGP